jgi:zinc and cadmium transporter
MSAPTTLVIIIAACLAGGLLSLLAAAFVSFRLPPQQLARGVAFAAGVMLAAAWLEILPEAFELAPDRPQELFATVLAAMIGFYFLERAALWRHFHAAPDDAPRDLGGAPWAILVGDGVHNFVDGVLIAGAFLADPWLGVVTAAAVVAHEIPQELGDFVLLLQAGWSRRRALIANGLSSMMSVAGGIVGWWALDNMENLLPFALCIAAASFLYIAVADLFPLLHRRHRADGFAAQSALLAAGLLCIPLLGHWLHHHH